jgi:aspartyl-tRNA(Asn)/glutamyl-tRNA(Gln) amidotransferase subunit C
MSITRDDVLHVARLARLDLEAAEVDRMLKDLGRILEYVDELSRVDTRDVPPTAYVAVETAPLRPDTAEGSIDRDVALREAPRKADGGFAVPAFVDEG